MIKILMVCLGNICRSPLAEGIMQDKISRLNLNAKVDSAGTSSWHAGEAPDKRAQKTARDHGLNISNLKARQFQVSDFEEFDLIYAMDVQNYNDIIRMTDNKDFKNKVHLILNESNPGENMSVPDPYFGGDEGFENVFRMLDSACDQILKRIENN